MSVEIIQQRLLEYDCKTVLEQENALKEIAQEIALLSLSRAGFFKKAAFQGGTCLRILYGLPRFSEDLDFILNEPDKNFDWQEYINNMSEEFNAYGYTLEIKNKAKLDKVIKAAFLKAESEGGLLILRDNRVKRPKLQIKLEIDTNPPGGSQYELNYLDFPMAYSVQTQDLPSLFTSKSYALLCREYIKGRDWYDFSWYVSKKTQLNYTLLENAINQAGPWQGKNIKADAKWYLNELKEKIMHIDWDKAKEDVGRFLKDSERQALDLWGNEFFLSRLKKLKGYLE